MHLKLIFHTFGMAPNGANIDQDVQETGGGPVICSELRETCCLEAEMMMSDLSMDR